MCQLVKWDKLDLNEQSILMKDFQRDAALFARDALFTEDPLHHSSVLTRLSSIARCVWSRNLKLYHILTRHSQLAREHLLMEDSTPRLSQPEAFEEAVRNAKNGYFSRARADLEEESKVLIGTNVQMTATGRKKAKADTIARLNALWVPTAPRINLS